MKKMLVYVGTTSLHFEQSVLQVMMYIVNYYIRIIYRSYLRFDSNISINCLYLYYTGCLN